MWKAVVTSAIFITAALDFAYCQKCPFGWYGYTSAPNSKCYKLVSTTKLTWADSKDYCRTLGGDLLKLESQQEWNWIVNQLKSITTRNHFRNPLWWTGLNNREYLTTWEWADGSPANKYIVWKPGEPNKNQERCGEIMNSNTFNDAQCSYKYYFICNRARGIPLACDTDRGWQPINGKCYKLYSRPNNWMQAKRQCSHDGASLVTIDSQQLDAPMHELAAGAKKSLWIGLHSLKVSATTNTWIWTNGTQLTTGYWHGTPHVARNLLNNTCAYISNTLAVGHDWNAGGCNTPRGYICQKPEGVCFPGWIGHGSNCYQFNPQYRLNYGAATTFCSQQNAELLRIDTSTDEMFVQSYLQEMKDSGSTSFWIGLSDDNHDGGPFKWRNHRAVGAFKNWATPHPTNAKGRRDCVYVLTTDAQGKWKITTSCQSARSVVCRIAMNKPVKPIARTPPPHYGCPANWRLFKTTCYKKGDRSTDQITARGRCQTQPGADLAIIDSAAAQGFVNRMVQQGSNYFIGLNDKAQNGVYVWNDNSAPTTYTNWKPGEPNDFHGGENCVILNKGQWNDSPCQSHMQYICSLQASSILNPSTPAPTPVVDWTVKCGPGWESNPVTNYCYMFSDQQLSWSDALLQCRVGGGGSLVSIQTLGEQNYLAGRLSSMSSVAVWTGANDRQTEGGWRWTSGDAFAYLNWAPGSPGGRRGGGTDCVAMLTSTAQWDDVRCDTRNGFICKKLGNVPTTTTARHPTLHLPAGKKIGCRLGWRSWSTYCYAFIKRTSSWDDAGTFCRSIGAHLTSVNSRNEQNFLQGHMPRSPGGNVWIGMSDKQIENRFQWSDGAAAVYTNWNTNEPNNWMNRNEDCVDMSLQNGKWNDEVCSKQLPGFVCKRPQGIVSQNQSPPPFVIGCTSGSFGYGSYCYKVVSGDRRSWASANSRCKAYHGALATVNDRFTQSFLASGLTRRTGNFWIGLSDKAKPGTYTWASGHNLLYTSWSKNHTGNEQSTCIAMSAQQPIGMWVNLDCSRGNNYICQLPRKGYTPPPTPGTPFPNVPCPQGWTANYAYCLRLFSDSSVQKSWMDASAFCQGLGGDLASFHTKGNDSVALTLIRAVKQSFMMGVWIGLNDRDTEGGHKWSDGSPVDYTNWNRGEPNNYQNAEDCAEMLPSSGWNDLNCYFQLPFLCAVPRGTVPSTTLAPPVAVSSAQCGSNPNGTSWFYYNNNCYVISPKQGSSVRLSYYDAQAYCQNLGATLASVHTEQENGLLMSKIHPYPQGSFWLGLNKLDNRAYKWTDGSPVDYVSWAKNQPDDYQGSERCSLLFKWTGLWNDDLCSQQRGFICKKPLHGSAHIVAPTPNTPGGCPNGFLKANGGRNKCFYISHGVKKTWSQAYGFCRSLGSKVDIASIEDAFETEFLITYAGKNRGNLWIGLNDHRGSNNFYWQDGSPVSYTNWDGNQPTSAKRIPGKKDTEDCVVVRMNKGHEGKWADVPCNLTFSFICEVKQDPNVPKHPLPAAGTCRQGYQFYNGGCYQAKSTPKSWTDAASDCKQDGGSLTSVNDVYELSFIGTLTSATSPYWIGMSDKNSPGLYYWADGSRVVYVRWGQNEPSYGQKNGNGCVLVDNQGYWNDTYCNGKHYYVCKISLVTPTPTQSPASGSCANPRWAGHGGYCYMANVNNGRSWPEANFMCQQNGMQLASIHSKGEMDFVFNLVKQTKVTNAQFTPNIWLGLSKSALGSFTWTDGSPTDYLYWAPTEPTSIGASGEIQECVVFDRKAENWATTSCYASMGFVCKTSKLYPTTSPFMTLALIVGTDGNVQIPSQNPQQQQQTGGNNYPASPGMTGGAIAGAVLGSILGILLIAFLVVFLVRSGKISLPLPRRGASEDESKTEDNGFDNNLYFKNNEADA